MEAAGYEPRGLRRLDWARVDVYPCMDGQGPRAKGQKPKAMMGFA